MRRVLPFVLSCPSANVAEHSNTHAAAAYEDNAEALQHSSWSHHPRQPQEEDDAEDVLEARQVNAHERPHLWRLGGRCSTEIEKKSSSSISNRDQTSNIMFFLLGEQKHCLMSKICLFELLLNVFAFLQQPLEVSEAGPFKHLSNSSG